ncbi:MAG: transglycosylase domain-containing protein [Actinomycetota bacterium]
MSAQKLKPSSVLGGVLGMLGFSILAGILVTAMVTPAIAVTSMTAQGSISIFENLPDTIKIGEQSQQNQIFALRAGQPVKIASVYKQNRQVVGWDAISPFLKKAAIDGEDRRFYKHGGVDLPSIARAVVRNGQGGQQSGSSTLDMQLVKNILVQQAFTATYTGKNQDEQRRAAIEKVNGFSIDRKLKEMKLAIGLDKAYTKKEILLGYLNIVGMGATTYGVESAAQQYFSVSAKDVTLPQAASLIATVQSPVTQSVSDPKYYPANKLRRDQILNAMLSAGDITQKERDAAVATTIESYVKISPPDNGCRTATPASVRAACDYASNVITVKDLPVDLGAAPLVTSIGASTTDRRANWDKGGYKIYTSIDLDLEENAQAALDLQAPASEARFKLGATANTIEGGTGRILVMAQNKIFDNAPADAAALTTSYNFSVDAPYGGTNGFDTGSTYKVVDLANWLQSGRGLNDIVNGRGPQTYDQSKFTASCDPGVLIGAGPYKLQNDGNSGGGPMTVKSALIGSVNNAFMQMALKQDLCGIRDTAKSMGAHRADFKKDLDVNPSTVLGSNEQAPLTMAGVAATVGAGGLRCAPIIIDKVVDPSGKELPGQAKTCTQALTPEVAAGVANAMIGSMQGGTSRPANPNDGVPIAGKTGTAPTLEQDWVVSTTTKVGSSVWTGNWDSALLSLKKFVNPNTRRDYYSSARFAIMKSIASAANKVGALKGSAFPAASAAVLSGSTVVVPTVSGQTVAQAQKVLTSLKFAFTDGGPEASGLPAGRVTRTDPAAGSKVSSGSSVAVFTSDGSLATTMPKVTGLTRQVADATIASAGFNPDQISYQWAKGNPLPGQSDSMCIVQASNPSSGSAAAKSDPITLTVYGKPDGSDPGGACPK